MFNDTLSVSSSIVISVRIHGLQERGRDETVHADVSMLCRASELSNTASKCGSKCPCRSHICLNCKLAECFKVKQTHPNFEGFCERREILRDLDIAIDSTIK